MSKLTWFRNKPRDVRVQRIHLNGNLIQCNPQQHYTMTLLPVFRVWVSVTGPMISSDPKTGKEQEMCTFGLMVTFLWWTVDIVDCTYLRNYKEPWAEDGKHRYISSWREHLKKQKH